MIILVLKDSKLWNNYMLPKLKDFYFSHLLPELDAPRHKTITGIRKPKSPWHKEVTSRFNPASNYISTTSQQTVTASSSQQTVTASSSQQTVTASSSQPSVTASSSQPSVTASSSQPSVTASSSQPSVTASSSSPPQPSCSFERICHIPNKQLRRIKFVGRRINHQWKFDDSTVTWFSGSVLDTSKGKDSDQKAVYQVLYDDEDEPYDVDDLINDHNDGSLKFCDL